MLPVLNSNVSTRHVQKNFKELAESFTTPPTHDPNALRYIQMCDKMSDQGTDKAREIPNNATQTDRDYEQFKIQQAQFAHLATAVKGACSAGLYVLLYAFVIMIVAGLNAWHALFLLSYPAVTPTIVSNWTWMYAMYGAIAAICGGLLEGSHDWSRKLQRQSLPSTPYFLLSTSWMNTFFIVTHLTMWPAIVGGLMQCIVQCYVRTDKMNASFSHWTVGDKWYSWIHLVCLLVFDIVLFVVINYAVDRFWQLYTTSTSVAVATSTRVAVASSANVKPQKQQPSTVVTPAPN